MITAFSPGPVILEIYKHCNIAEYRLSQLFGYDFDIDNMKLLVNVREPANGFICVNGFIC